MPATRRSKQINWVFHDPKNAKSKIKCIEISNRELDCGIWLLDWAGAFEEGFKFKLDKSTIEFWAVSRQLTSSYPISNPLPQPSTPLLVRGVGRDWVKNHPVDQVANSCQDALLAHHLCDEPWDSDRVHLIVTAQELVGGDTHPTKQSDVVPELSELPLHILHRRES